MDDGFNVVRAGGLMPTDRFLPVEENARSLSETRILINTETAIEREQIKGWVAQALSSGTLLLEQWSVESEMFLSSLGLTDLLWESHDELKTKIAYWLDDQQKRDTIAKNAREAYQKKYNPVSYTRNVLKHL